MKNLLKRWRLVSDELEVSVGTATVEDDIAANAADALKTFDRRPDRIKNDYPGVSSLEGDLWQVHPDNGTVYLSGEDGLVQVQFAPVDAYSLGTLLQQSAQE